MASTVQKLLIPLSTAAVAGAVLVGSGAEWTSESATSISVAGGTVVHTNSRDDFTLTVADLKPGATVSDTLTIANTGSLDATVAIEEVTATNNFSAGMLTLTITDQDGNVVYAGEFGGMTDDTPYVVGGTLQEESDDAVTLTVEIALDEDSPNDDQGQTAGATFRVVSTQTDATNVEHSNTWVDNTP
jgi:hypothetical protein